MAKEKLLDILVNRKSKADELLKTSASKLPIYLVGEYLSIIERICFLEGMKFLMLTSPASMNPKKYQEHAKFVLSWTKKYCNSPELSEYYGAKEREVLDFCPNTVDAYPKFINNYSQKFMILWNNKNKESED